MIPRKHPEHMKKMAHHQPAPKFPFDMSGFVSLKHKQTWELQVFGFVNKLTIEGPTDKDKDGFPEFKVNLDLPGKAFDVSTVVELDPKVLMKDGPRVFQSVVEEIAKKGFNLPEELLAFLKELAS